MPNTVLYSVTGLVNIIMKTAGQNRNQPLASWVIPITAIQINKQRLGVNFLKRPDDFISINLKKRKQNVCLNEKLSFSSKLPLTSGQREAKVPKSKVPKQHIDGH